MALGSQACLLIAFFRYIHGPHVAHRSLTSCFCVLFQVALFLWLAFFVTE